MFKLVVKILETAIKIFQGGFLAGWPTNILEIFLQVLFKTDNSIMPKTVKTLLKYWRKDSKKCIIFYLTKVVI